MVMSLGTRKPDAPTGLSQALMYHIEAAEGMAQLLEGLIRRQAVCPANYHHQHSVRSQRAVRWRRIAPGGRGPVETRP